MGIKDLTIFLKEYAPNSISKGNLSQLGGYIETKIKSLNDSEEDKIIKRKKRAAIDTSLFLYKYKYRAGDNFINEFLEQINRLLVNDIEPIYVFDGIPPSEKMDTINSRKERKQASYDKIKDIEIKLANPSLVPNSEEEKLLKEELFKTKKKTISVTTKDINRLKYFLDIMNITHIKRDMEADIVCSRLSQLGLVEYVISEDMDHLTSGTKILLRDFNNKNNYVTVYKTSDVLLSTGLSNEKWIELCILFGCDYVQRIRGMGYKTSYKYIKENLDQPFCEILSKIKSKNKYNIEEDYTSKFNKAKLIFLNENDIDLDNTIFNTNKDIFDNQVKVVKDYLINYTSFSQLKIKNRIKNIFGYCI